MLLTVRADAFKRLPKVSLHGDLGFRDQCNHCLNKGFVPYTTPFSERYEQGQVTRFYGRTNDALVPLDASHVIVADDYIVAKSDCGTMLIVYFHKGRKDKYCEVTHSPDTDFVEKMFDYYRITCGRIHEEIVNVGDKAS